MKTKRQQMTDEEILVLYSQWSEEYYCAGFISASPGTVREFRKWLTDRKILYLIPILHDYEGEMLEEFHKQESF